MTREETFITELEKLKTEKNAPLVEGIVKAFKACTNDAHANVTKSIAVLENARNGQDKVAFFECLSNAVVSCDAADRADAFAGLEMYKKYLLMK